MLKFLRGKTKFLIFVFHYDFEKELVNKMPKLRNVVSNSDDESEENSKNESSSSNSSDSDKSEDEVDVDSSSSDEKKVRKIC